MSSSEFDTSSFQGDATEPYPLSSLLTKAIGFAEVIDTEPLPGNPFQIAEADAIYEGDALPVVVQIPQSPAWSQAGSISVEPVTWVEHTTVRNLSRDITPSAYVGGTVVTTSTQLSGSEELVLINTMNPITLTLFPLASTQASSQSGSFRVITIRIIRGPATQVLQTAPGDVFDVTGTSSYRLISHRTVQLVGQGNTWYVI